MSVFFGFVFFEINIAVSTFASSKIIFLLKLINFSIIVLSINNLRGTSSFKEFLGTSVGSCIFKLLK